MNENSFIDNQHTGTLSLNRDEKKSSWLHNKSPDFTKRVAKMTYIIAHNFASKAAKKKNNNNREHNKQQHNKNNK